MPELPEVERVRLTLQERVANQIVTHVAFHRSDVVRLGAGTAAAFHRCPATEKQVGLLAGHRITRFVRHGKQLAMIGQNVSGHPLAHKVDHDQGSQRDHDHNQPERCVCIHLGMSGSLLHRRPDQPVDEPHTHVVWTLDSGDRLIFRDPRRFGGLWAFPDLPALEAARWASLGPDALSVKPRDLHARLQATRRHLKAAMLDQTVLAGMGNIYVDELLFNCRLHPMTPANRLALNTVQKMVPRMRMLLARAIRSGGSSLRDYVDGEGGKGSFQLDHRVYGRAGLPCVKCAAELRSELVAGRTTVFCPHCQSGESF